MQEKTIVILTGAGISAESGLQTFRDQNGLWCNHRIEEVATPEAFRRNPALVQQFYNARRAQLKEAKPNAAHQALAELAERWQGSLYLVTQNVDDLHARATEGKRVQPGYRLLPMHGELKKARCAASGTLFTWDVDIDAGTPCPCCGQTGSLRPHIVWFGEMPLYMEEITTALAECDLFISIGTSGNVYPAAGFTQEVRVRGRGRTVELNLEPSLGHSLFDEAHYGPATQVVPEFVRTILDGTVL